MPQKTLAEWPFHSPVKVLAISGPQEICQRLVELGFFPGLELVVEGRTPFSGPLIVSFGAAKLAVREVEARCLVVET